MSLFSKIKNFLGRGASARPPVGDQRGETPAGEAPAALPPSSGRGPDSDSGLKNSIVRGVVEGAARETARKFLEEVLGN
ncbi:MULTISPECIES: hypothetical protein [unclassified Streptomyces]|uniref:hypothetical protein n=1 Tax=unclassified Streptomyces TaxID=2593676 RepID=UPI002E174B36|nr:MULTISPECIES: hypothetical protein [unclassified Streptomyces]